MAISSDEWLKRIAGDSENNTKNNRWLHSYKGYNFVRTGTKEYPWNVYKDDGFGIGEHITFEKSLKDCKAFVDDLIMLEDLDDIDNDGEGTLISAEEEDFANDFFNVLQSIIDEEQSNLEENFPTKKSLKRHYDKHCIGKKSYRKSDRHNIFYDFTNIMSFSNYENKVLRLIDSSTNSVFSLYNIKQVERLYRNLFKGRQTMRFEFSCGFTSNGEDAVIGLRSFANDATENYSKGSNTIDLIAISRKGETITIYPVDANYLQTKLNNVIENHTNRRIRYFFNH